MRPKIWVKICGVTRAADASAAADAGADAIGVNFVPTSRRCCTEEAAREIVRAVGERIRVYGVFAGADRTAVERAIERTGITGVQFHGGESDADVAGWNLPVIRAIAAVSRERVAEALAAAGAYRVLIDSPIGGGSGSQFDRSVVAGQDLSEAIVAGGLTPANVAATVAAIRPWGVDVAGGVETSPGIKEHCLIQEFIRNATSTT